MAKKCKLVRIRKRKYTGFGVPNPYYTKCNEQILLNKVKWRDFCLNDMLKSIGTTLLSLSVSIVGWYVVFTQFAHMSRDVFSIVLQVLMSAGVVFATVWFVMLIPELKNNVTDFIAAKKDLENHLGT